MADWYQKFVSLSFITRNVSCIGPLTNRTCDIANPPVMITTARPSSLAIVAFFMSAIVSNLFGVVKLKEDRKESFAIFAVIESIGHFRTKHFPHVVGVFFGYEAFALCCLLCCCHCCCPSILRVVVWFFSS